MIRSGTDGEWFASSMGMLIDWTISSGCNHLSSSAFLTASRTTSIEMSDLITQTYFASNFYFFHSFSSWPVTAILHFDFPAKSQKFSIKSNYQPLKIAITERNHSLIIAQKQKNVNENPPFMGGLIWANIILRSSCLQILHLRLRREQRGENLQRSFSSFSLAL